MADNTIVKYSGDWIFYQGAAAAGALLYVYDAGTTDLASIFTDKDLTVASANPVTADSGGLMPFAYRGTSSYKVVLKTSSGTTIDTEDNISGALDTSTFAAATFAKSDSDCAAKTTDYTMLAADIGTTLNVNPTSATITITLLSAVTTTNGRGITIRHTGTANQVNIATVSGQTIDGFSTKSLLGQHESLELVSDGANWHVRSDGNRTVYGGTIHPQGYLTLTSGTPIITGDVAAATSVYYTPFTGNLIPLYDGTRWVLYEFSELTLTLAAQHATDTNYDVFVFLNSGTVTVGTGPAWTTSTAGSGARGTGAGTTQLTRTKGLLANTVSMTARNSSSTYTVAAARGTYVGTIRIDGTAGQITCHVTYGQSRKWSVWNAYNRQPIVVKVGDATASWNWTTDSFHASNANAANSATTLCGLAEEWLDCHFLQNVANGSAAVTLKTGIGVNSTTAASGFVPATNTTTSTTASLTARHAVAPALGAQTITSLERSTAAGASNWSGGEDDCRLTIQYRG